MILKNIEIKNFRCYGSFTMKGDFSKDLNVITGKNNVGKSTIINAINYVLNNKKLNFNDINVKEIEKIYHNYENANDFEVTIKLQYEFFDNSHLTKILPLMKEIDVKGLFDIKIVWNIDKIKFEEFISSWKQKEDNRKKKYFKNHFSDTLKNTTFVNDLKVDNHNLIHIWEFTHIPALRIKDNSELIYENYFKKYNNELKSSMFDIISDIDDNISEKLKSEPAVQKLISEYKKIASISDDYSLESNNLSNLDISKMEMLLKSSENLFGVSQKSNGTGLINILYIVSIIAEVLNKLKKSNQSYATIVIEEPEAFTHSELETNLLQYINKISKEYNLQIIIISHSPSLVSKISSEKIYYLNTEVLSKINLFADSKFIKNYIDINRSKLIFATKVIFVEGPTEEILLKWIINNCKEYINIYETYEIFVLNSKFTVEHWNTLITLFDFKKVVLITDNDYSTAEYIKKIQNKEDFSYIDVKVHTTNEILKKLINKTKNEWNNDNINIYTQNECNNIFGFNNYIPRSLEDSILANNPWLFEKESNFKKKILNRMFNKDIENKDIETKINRLTDSNKMLSKNSTKYDFINEIIDLTDDIITSGQSKVNQFLIPKYILDALNEILSINKE